jgi:hypothetical protein
VAEPSSQYITRRSAGRRITPSELHLPFRWFAVVEVALAPLEARIASLLAPESPGA